MRNFVFDKHIHALSLHTHTYTHAHTYMHARICPSTPHHPTHKPTLSLRSKMIPKYLDTHQKDKQIRESDTPFHYLLQAPCPGHPLLAGLGVAPGQWVTQDLHSRVPRQAEATLETLAIAYLTD